MMLCVFWPASTAVTVSIVFSYFRPLERGSQRTLTGPEARVVRAGPDDDGRERVLRDGAVERDPCMH